MIQASTITQKGQVTIPSFIREKLGLAPGMKVVFRLEANSIKVSSLPSFFSYRGSIKSKKEFNIKKMRREAQKHVSQRYGKNT
jgi:AbrB family looped-hinge helix DNA binding protein